MYIYTVYNIIIIVHNYNYNLHNYYNNPMYIYIIYVIMYM